MNEVRNVATRDPVSFRLGRLLATPGALSALETAGQTPQAFIERHRRGDWGEVGKEDWDANQAALVQGTRLLSAYRTSKGVRIWIITEWNRSATTVLLPEEY